VDKNKVYSLKDASTLVKEINCTKFDSSVDLHIRLGVDPKKADQQVRGTVSLPHGTGKTKRVLVLCTPDKEAAAKEAGADFVGLDELYHQDRRWLGRCRCDHRNPGCNA
jgi:large subunit ribosomal protein L1